MRNWESGAVRIPYAAYKLMRVLKGGKILGPEWRDFYVWRGVLHTPEGHRFEAGELSWWSLLVRRARAFSDLLAVQELGAKREKPSVSASRVPVVLVSAGRERVKKNRLSELPSSNRGVSETERLLLESVPLPLKRCAATLPKAGVAARKRAGGAS